MLQRQSEIKSIRNFYFPVFFFFISFFVKMRREKTGHDLKNMYSNLCIDLEGRLWICASEVPSYSNDDNDFNFTWM